MVRGAAVSIAADTLTAAAAAVEDRHEIYGPPHQNFERIADFWSTYLGGKYGVFIRINTADVALMSALVKIARLQETPGHLDSWVDVAGYAGCGAEVSQSAVVEP